MKRIRIYLGYAIGTLLASPVLYVIFGFCWALLTPIDIERDFKAPDPSIRHAILCHTECTLELSQSFWAMSGPGWFIGMERHATCYPSNKGYVCLRYGSPLFYADLIKMARHSREEEQLRLRLEEGSKKGPTT